MCEKNGTKNISITDLSLCLLSMTPTCTPSWTRMRTMSYSSSPSIDVLFISFIILIRYLTAIVKLRMKVMRICLNLFEMHISPEKSKLVFALYSWYKVFGKYCPIRRLINFSELWIWKLNHSQRTIARLQYTNWCVQSHIIFWARQVSHLGETL